MVDQANVRQVAREHDARFYEEIDNQWNVVKEWSEVPGVEYVYTLLLDEQAPNEE
jgi:hypothetical protein